MTEMRELKKFCNAWYKRMHAFYEKDIPATRSTKRKLELHFEHLVNMRNLSREAIMSMKERLTKERNERLDEVARIKTLPGWSEHETHVKIIDLSLQAENIDMILSEVNDYNKKEVAGMTRLINRAVKEGAGVEII